ncbi:hypothetical protein LguiB_026129 [Lonicera macranthoides]
MTVGASSSPLVHYTFKSLTSPLRRTITRDKRVFLTNCGINNTAPFVCKCVERIHDVPSVVPPSRSLLVPASSPPPTFCVLCDDGAFCEAFDKAAVIFCYIRFR